MLVLETFLLVIGKMSHNGGKKLKAGSTWFVLEGVWLLSVSTVVKGKNKGVTRGSRREKGLRSVLRKEVKSGTVVSTGV